VNEALPVVRQAAGGDDGVHVRVEGQCARPGVQDERGAEHDAEAAVTELEQRLGGGVEQRVEHRLGRELGEGAKLARQREDDVEVPDVEEPLLTLRDPLLLGERLTLRAMPVAARVVRRVLVAARSAEVDMAPERGGAALRDVRQHPPLLARQRMADLELRPMRAHDVADVVLRSPGLRRARRHWRTKPPDGKSSSGLGAFWRSAVETRV
jgi:hypothetical protein